MKLDIYTISLLFSKQQIIALGLFTDSKKDSESQYLQFFELILNGDIRSDEEAIEHFDYENVASFRKFRSRYSDKLLDYLILSKIRENPLDEINEQYFRLLKYFIAARVLHFNLQNKDATKLYKSIFEQSKMYGFHDLGLLASIPLRSHFGYVEPKKKLYCQYVDEVKTMTNHFIKRLELDSIYDDLSHKNTFLGTSDRESQIDEAKKKSEYLLSTIEKSDFRQYVTKVLEIASYSSALSGDFEKSVEISKRAVKVTQDNPYGNERQLKMAYKDTLFAYLKLQDYDNAKVYMKKLLAIKHLPGHNYYRTKGLEFGLYAITKDYRKLYTIVSEVLSIRQLKKMRMHFEEWTIREAFVHIMIDAEKIDPESMTQSLRKFRINRFINEVELFAKDKRGMNIAIHVVQLMHYLMRKEYHKIVDRLDALNQYTYRYLRNDESLRSNCFIKMLLKLPEAEYHPIRTKRYVAKYEKKLLATPYEVSLKDVSVEIIPYEYLWEIIIATLEKNQSKRA